MNATVGRPERISWNRPFGLYIVLAFGGAWAIESLLAAVGVRLDGPTAAIWLLVVSVVPGVAALVAARLHGSVELWRDLTSRIRTWRVGPRWYGVALAAPIVTVGLAAAGSAMFGEAVVPQPTILVVAPLVLAANFAEEIGWRGFALPAMLGRMGALRASLVLGSIWFAWHVPIQLLIPGDDKLVVLLALFLQLTGLSILLTWVSIHARGAVIIAATAHASFNVAGNVLPLVTAQGQLVLGFACLIMAAIVVAIGGPGRGRGSDPS